MKTASCILYGTLLSALSIGAATARPISVKLTGHVSGVTGGDIYLGGQVQLNEAVTATYTYDTSAPDLDASGNGAYELPVADGAAVRIVIGTFVFESDSASQITASVSPSSELGPGGWSLTSSPNKPLPDGTLVDWIQVYFGDYTGTGFTSDALPDGAPDVQAFDYRRIIVSGAPWGAMEVDVDIDSAELVPPAIEISPASGKFLSQQHFDAAVLLPIGAQVTSMQASVNGSPVALSYPGTCQLVPPNSLGRPAILCPNAHTILASSTSDTKIDWRVTLADGTVYTDYVDWTRIPQ